MATRKKKKKEIAEETSATKIKYSGVVTVKIQQGKRIIKSNTYKNNGGLELWKFLCNCIAGNYHLAEIVRPLKIKLYQSGIGEGAIPEDWWDDKKDLTPIIFANTATDARQVSSQNNYVATIHFNIPSAVINGNNVVNFIALFPQNYNSNDPLEDKTKYSACFLFRDEEDPTKWGKQLDLRSMKGNYTIIIDWQMSFDNK